MKSKIILTAILLLSVIAAGTLQAQTNTNTATDPDNGNSFSPTNISTSGRFKTAIDDYISPQDYTSLNLNNLFSYASWATPGQPQLGFAKQINSVYLALYYKGTLWGGVNNFASREEIVPTFMGGTDSKILTTYTIPNPLDYPDNSVAVLVGFANMGIRLGFSSTYDTFTSDGDMRVETAPSTYKYYTDYELENGNLVPQIKWAMAKDLLEQGIRPYATATVNIHRENLRFDQYTTFDKTTGDQIGYSQNYLQPSLAVGLGGFTFYNKDDLKFSLDVDYTIKFTVYDNDYSYAIDTFAVVNPDDYTYGIKTISGTWGPTSATNPNPILRERSNIYNSVVPSFSGSWSVGNLGIKTKLRVNLDFDSTTTTDMDVVRDVTTGITNGDLQKHGNDESKDTFTVTPRLDLGLQYKVFPKRLTLNIGGRLARSIAYTTTSVKVYQEGKEDGNQAYNVKNVNYGDMTWRLYAGFMFNFNENVWFEAVTGVENGVNVFGTGVNGLFNFTSLAFGFKI